MLCCRQRFRKIRALLRLFAHSRAVVHPHALRSDQHAMMGTTSPTAYGQIAFVVAMHSHAGKCRHKSRYDQYDQLQDG